MRRWLAPLLLLSACADGGPSQPAASATATTTSTTAISVIPGSSAPTNPAATVPATTAPAVAPVVPSGFDLTAARVVAADGTTCDLCLWVADSGDLRRQGLMTVTDLGQGDGMAFVYGGPTTTRFWMGNTPLPLSIAFFGVDGGFIDSFDMDPCFADASDCPRYSTPDDIVIAVETYQGGLPALDMTPGSTLTLLDLPCQS